MNDHKNDPAADATTAKGSTAAFGTHNYRLADFGLSEQVMNEAFSSYRQAHAIPFE